MCYICSVGITSGITHHFNNNNVIFQFFRLWLDLSTTMPPVISLVIKTPSLKLSDLTYSCESTSSVHQLKLFLENQYPSKPVSYCFVFLFSSKRALLIPNSFRNQKSKDWSTKVNFYVTLTYLRISCGILTMNRLTHYI